MECYNCNKNYDKYDSYLISSENKFKEVNICKKCNHDFISKCNNNHIVCISLIDKKISKILDIFFAIFYIILILSFLLLII